MSQGCYKKSFAQLVSGVMLSVLSLSALAGEYKTQYGDTLSDIAAKVKGADQHYLSTMQWLVNQNPGAFISGDPDRLKANIIIKLPGELDSQASALPAKSDALLYQQFEQAVQQDIVDVKKTITAVFKRVRPEWQLQFVKMTPIVGVYEVQVLNGPLVYSSAEGDYFIAGDLYKVAVGGFVNLAEQKREGARAQTLAKVALEDMIVFSPKTAAKTYVSVFTDIDCGYCRKLHNEVAELNRLGVEVRYLAYPRAGLGSKSFQKIATAWCAENPNEALTQLKMGKNLPMNVCTDNPVSQHFMLGQQVGVNGTPALVTPEGKLLPGYMPAKQLAATLGVAVK